MPAFSELSADEQYVLRELCVEGEHALSHLRWLSYRWFDRDGAMREEGPGAGVDDPLVMQPRAKAAVERLLRLDLVGLYVLYELPEPEPPSLIDQIRELGRTPPHRSRTTRLERRYLDTNDALDVIADDRNWNDLHLPVGYEVYAAEAGVAVFESAQGKSRHT